MLNVTKEAAVLERMTTAELRAKYAELFQEATRTGNRRWLLRRILWRLQSLAEGGGLSERARQRAEELASTSDLRVTAPRQSATPEMDERVPLPGTLLTRRYKGRLIQVRVLPDGFEFEGERYRSLSAVAKQLTGSHWNGCRFFNLAPDGETR